MSGQDDEPPRGERGRGVVRAKLIEAATALLADAPPAEVTSKQIADAAGVNHGQIHHYFGSKHQLVAATITDPAAKYQQDRAADAEHFPLPIETEVRSPAWRTLAYLASAGVWRQPPFDPSPVVAALAQRRAADRGCAPDDTVVLADVAATMSMQRGWWIFGDIIETTLRAFDPDVVALRRSVAERSARLLDESIPLGEPVAEADLAPEWPDIRCDGPRGRDEVQMSLIRAAFELLAEQPPSQVTTKQIAARAGVNHGQVHHYFESKEHLIAQTTRHGSSVLLRELEGDAAELVPVRTTSRHPMWRTLAHIASTEDWVHEAFGRAPVVARLVEVVAERTGRAVTDPDVHSQVAAAQALELGWAVYRDIIEYGLQPLDADLPAVRARLAAISCRLVDDDVRSGRTS